MRWQRVTIVLVALLALRAGAQQDQPEDTLTIRATTRLVLVDVVVTDKNGAPVEDLKQEDVTLYEEGKPQQLKLFQLERAAASAAPQLPPLPANIRTNRPEYAPAGPPVTLLFDVVNTPRADWQFARDKLIEFVERQPPGQEITILALTSRLVVVQRPTSDRRLLLAALRRFFPHLENPQARREAVSDLAMPEATAPEEAAMYERMLASVREMENLQKVNRAEMAVQALQAIVRANAGRRGRKVLVWLAGGFPVELARMDTVRASLATDFKKTINMLADAQFAVYPVDARGLTTIEVHDATGTVRDAGGRALRGHALADLQSQMRGEFEQSQHAMELIAKETGGRAYKNRNDLDKAIAAALSDGAAYYTLAYTPSDSKWNGDFREIEVKVRRPGVQLRHRRGYFALDPQKQQPAADLRQQVRFNTLAAASVTFAGRVRRQHGNDVVEVAVDLPTVASEPAGAGGRRVRLALYAASFSATEQPLKQNGASFAPEFSRQKYDQLLGQGLFLKLELPSDPKAEFLRVAVKDELSGAIGSLEMPLPAAK